MEIGLVRKIDIDEEMQQAYLDYAMSVIVARALPDARDGLKPVHRRILYAMHDMGLASNASYKKSARIVGEVLGKYHPHGDMAVYDAMARMAQTFSMRALLVDGQGNFGSVDGDPPAAMRYTEARLTTLAESLLSDINKNTVDFLENFDGTLTEPEVTPAAIPNLLVNGATGIAVGMMTSIPPHNLGEVIDALIYMLENWEKLDDITIEGLMRFIQGPDFPTGGVIIQDQDGDSLASAYATGRGRVIVQAQAHLEEMVRGRNRIIVTELPYMTNKASLIERIADLVRAEKLEGIADLRDESDRQGMRIVIELNKAADPETVLRDLYKNTQMRSTFSLIMLALVGGEPRLLSLKQALRVYLEHRQTIVRRRSEFDLARARQRAHILEGLRVALSHLDEVISLIRKAPDADTARQRLMKRFRLSEIQAQAILDMPLRRLAALERKKIEDEYKELLATIKNLESLLRSSKKMRQVVGEELYEIRKAFADPRRTRIVHLGEGESRASMLTTTDMVPEQSVWVMISPDGLISYTAGDKQPKLTGQELASVLFQANTHDTLYLASESGEAAAIPLHVLPQAGNPRDGAPFYKLSPLKAEDRLAAAFSLPPREARADGHYLLTVTDQGMVKKTALDDLPGPSAQTFTLVRVNSGDRLGWVQLTDGQADLLLATSDGMAIRFKEDDVRPMGLVAAGVMGIKLGPGAKIVGAELFPKRGQILLVANDGSAKRVDAQQFPRQGRYGQGVIAWKLPRGVQVVGITAGKPSDRVTILLEKGVPKTIRLDEAPLQGRAARGKAVLPAKAGLKVTGLIAPRMAEYGRPNVPTSRSAKDLIDGHQDAAGNLSKPARKVSKARTKKSKGAGSKKPRSAETKSEDATKTRSRDGEKTKARKGTSGKKAASAKTTASKSARGTKKAAELKTLASKKSPAKRTSAKDKPAVAKKAVREQPAVKEKPAVGVKRAVGKKPAAGKKLVADKQPATKKRLSAAKKEVSKSAAKSTAKEAGKAAKKTNKPASRKTSSAAKPPTSKTVTKTKTTSAGKKPASGKGQEGSAKTGQVRKSSARKKHATTLKGRGKLRESSTSKSRQ